MKTKNSYFRRFLLTFVLALSSGALAVIAFVAIIDPYGLVGIVNRDDFNAVKPGLTRYQSQIKQEHARRLLPQFIILGNSRAEIGFDPGAPAFASLRGAGYNLAIPGIGLATSARQFAQLVDAGVKPRTVILGMEFIDFLNASSALPARPATASAPPGHGPRFWRFDTLFSLTSIKDAIHTLRIQHDREAVTTSPDGFNPLLEYGAYVRDDGYHKIFKQRAQENAVNFRKKSTTGLAAEDFQSLHAFLLTMSATHADIKLVIYPYHAQILAMFEAAGLWPLFEQWKKQLVLEIDHVKKQHPSAQIALADFSGFGSYNCERIPRENERNIATLWYWEAGHFKKALGDIVLGRVMSQKPHMPHDGDFGMQLDASTLISNSERIATERSACAAAQPDLFLFSKKLFDRHLLARPPGN